MYAGADPKKKKGVTAVSANLFSADGPYAGFMNWLWNILVISVLWLLCSIPVFTMGAASTAAYYAMAKSVRHHTGTVTAEFFSSFRRNFRQASGLTILTGSVLAVLVLECVYLYSDPAVPLGVLYLFYFLTGAAAACAIYLWPCLSRFDKGSFALLSMAIILVFRHLITTVLLLLLLAAAVLGVYLMPWGILLFPGLTIWLQTFLMEKVLLRYSPAPEGGEARKWYYQ